MVAHSRVHVRLAQARKKFQRRTGCTEEEARKYLETADIDLVRAK